MKQSKMCPGRGFDSRPVHHEHIRLSQGDKRFRLQGVFEYADDGPDLVSTGQGVVTWTAG